MPISVKSGLPRHTPEVLMHIAQPCGSIAQNF